MSDEPGPARRMQDRTGRRNPTARIAALRLDKWSSSLSSAYLGRPFASGSSPRLLIYHAPNRISYTQVYPFFHYHRDLKHQLGLDVRARPVDDFLEGRVETGADIIMVQPWFDVAVDQLATALDRLRARHPDARIVFVDSYAHNDMRLVDAQAGRIDLLVKKSLLADRSEFRRARAGDTNLAEYYGLLYDTFREPVAPHVPDGFLDLMQLSPGFLTAPHFIQPFLTGPAPDTRNRPIDVHARIEQKGSPWYAAMRKAAEESIRAIDGISLTPQGRVPLKLFLDEMRQSKLCWSPFGYGELCWRDIEAFLTGSVLIKQDMSHMETRPDLFRPGETYLPVKWDFSNLEEVVRSALANEALRDHIAQTAFAMCRDFLGSSAFADQYAPLLFPKGAVQR